MRNLKILTAMLFVAGLGLAGCSDDQMDNRPPPAAPSISQQDNSAINHEEANPSVPAPETHSMPAQK